MDTKEINLEKKSLSELIEQIVKLTKGQRNIVTAASRPYAEEIGHRLNLSPVHSTILAILIANCDRWRIDLSTIANHFGTVSYTIVDQIKVIEDLIDLGFVKLQTDDDGNDRYKVLPKMIRDLSNGIMPKRDIISNLTIELFLEKVFDSLKLREKGEIDDPELYERVKRLIDLNQNLSFARQLKLFSMHEDDLILFLVMCRNYIMNDDDQQTRREISNFTRSSTAWQIIRKLENGTHPLMEKNLVEHVCEDGIANPSVWKLTDHAKKDVLYEFEIKPKEETLTAGLTLYTDIKEKDMFYNEKVSRQVSKLESLLEPERMTDVLKSLESHGMRKGFTCLYYGAPGTGKSETALQLARRTKRNIMLVDIPSIRSKWVGETEKNIKAVFTRYGKLAKDNPNAPILLFNEADALFTKRKEGGTGVVDKMENAMQNIILQELENLEGILIATTNLSGSLDDAFERRFLYKIEFEKPLPEQRMHIWKAMLPDLSDADANNLAEKYDFSGGQIENIARKRIVNDIIECHDGIDLESIIESCENERINQKKSVGGHIGFN